MAKIQNQNKGSQVIKPITLKAKNTDDQSLYQEDQSKKYLRVGTRYYRKNLKLTSLNEHRTIIEPWTRQTILEDHTIRILGKIKKYVSFVNIPENNPDKYNREIKIGDDTYYNIYEPVKYKPEPGDCSKTLNFLKHLFSDKYEFILDYLSLIYLSPLQKLPAICLVSIETTTGKSTFIKWLEDIYSENAITLGNEDFGSNFNSLWASKLLVFIDETAIEKRIITEKIKRLITDNQINIEAKGRDQINIPWHGKFVLLSNDESNFIDIAENDTRFFISKAPTIKKTEIDFQLKDKMKNEIPHFLHFLICRKLMYEQKNRLWFSPEVLHTDARQKVIRSTRTKTEKAMLNYFEEIFNYTIDDSEKITEIQIVPKILAEILKPDLKTFHYLPTEIEKVFKDAWGLLPNKNNRYSYPILEYSLGEIKTIVLKPHVGRYYSIKKELIDSKIL